MPRHQRRQPSGTPKGGQFAHDQRREAEITLEDDTWPPVTWEEHRWERNPDAPRPSRRQLRAHTGPYQASVPPLIAEITPQLPGDVLAAADEATREIARYDAEVGHEPMPYAALLLRSEASASSQIENLTASPKAIALAELGDTSRTNATLVVNNAKAMQAAVDLADTLDRDAILGMHEVLLGDTNPDMVGGWRDQPVWIGGTMYGPHQAAFVPPHASRVPKAMDDLVAFLDRDDMPVLAQAAIAHAQFETIHPFPDGNGRTGRALVHAHLRGKDVTRSVTVPVSAGLLTDTGSYFDALTAYRDGDPVAIVEQFSDAAWRAVDNGRMLVDDLRTAKADWDSRITARRDAAAWPLATLLVEQPVVTSKVVQNTLGVSAPAADNAIRHLEERGVVTQSGGGRRNRRWAAPDVLAALEDFAIRTGRRR